MHNHCVIYKENQLWKGKNYITEYVDSIDFASIYPVTQVQALCIDQDGNYVIYQDNEGKYGSPGGTIADETFEEALYREIAEEVACTVLEYKPLLYLKNTNPPDAPIKTTYQLRYVARVALTSDQINDPAGKAIRRVIVDSESDLKQLLQWGKKLEIYLDAARKTYA